ncbi:MAG: type II toxin-antitoxin system RelE/ParE family toxin [Armatimonadetes bacterium]|nr:type II toxin-antitoxin system RelE/ParE family toxin [Armatimonadota bacterium]
MIVRLTPPAKAQLLAAVAYINADRPAAVRDFRRRVDGALRRLIDLPESGRLIPEFSGLGFREVLVGPHRWLYRVQGNVVWVVGVWHDAQIPDEPGEPANAQQAGAAGHPPVAADRLTH